MCTLPYYNKEAASVAKSGLATANVYARYSWKNRDGDVIVSCEMDDGCNCTRFKNRCLQQKCPNLGILRQVGVNEGRKLASTAGDPYSEEDEYGEEPSTPEDVENEHRIGFRVIRDTDTQKALVVVYHNDALLGSVPADKFLLSMIDVANALMKV